jgi:hypothetical protein
MGACQMVQRALLQRAALVLCLTCWLSKISGYGVETVGQRGLKERRGQGGMRKARPPMHGASG